MIGIIFLILAILFGKHALAIIYLIPMSVLGILLVFAGSQLCLMIKDIKDKTDLFVVIIMLGITLATNLAVAFVTGIIVAYAFKTGKLKV
jgi:SulP family sulfate permease